MVPDRNGIHADRSEQFKTSPLLVNEAAAPGANRSGLVRNVFSVGLIQVANYVFPMISLVVVSRIIGPERFGVINFAAAFMVYFTLLINYGFDLSATRLIAANRADIEERNRVFSEVVSARFLLFLASLLMFLASLFLIPQLREEKQVAIFSFLLCFSWVITPNWLYQGMQELTKVAWFNLAAKILFTGAILLIVREKDDYVWQPLAVSLAQILVGVWSFVYAIRRYGIRPRFARLRRVLHLLWNERILFFSMVVINLYTTTNVVLLGLLQTEEQVGYYTAAWRLIVVIQSLVAIPISQALFPFIGTAFAGGRERGLDLVRKFLPLITVITGLVSLTVWFAGPFAISLMYGSQYASSIAAFRILAFVPLMIGWSNLFGIQTMVNLKMDRAFFRITAAGAVLSIALNLALVSRFGYIGTAWSWLLTEVLIAAAMFFTLRLGGIDLLEPRYFTLAHFRKTLRPLSLILKQKLFTRT